MYRPGKLIRITYKLVAILLLLLTIEMKLANAITVPSNIVYYLPITLVNNQNIALTSNTEITFIFNALAYQAYETNSLNNTELFYSNGTIVASWMEGDTVNTLVPGNQLYKSSNVRFWIRSPATSTFLPANTGTATINTIYLGFTGNTPTSANNLLNNFTTGEAPRLSPTFGQYDNGANVFSLYTNFQGNSLPNGWSLQGVASFIGGTSGTGGVRILNNAGFTSGAVSYNNPFTTQNIIIETSEMYNGRADAIFTAFYANSPRSGCPALGYCAGYEFYSGSKPFVTINGVTTLAPFQDMPSLQLNYVFTQVLVTPNSITANFIPSGVSLYPTGVYAGLTTAFKYTGSTINNANGIFYLGGNDGLFTASEYVYWTRIRQSPPNGVMPNASIGPTISVAPFDQITSLGGTAVITSSTNGGLSPYSYQWLATEASGSTFTASQANSICSNAIGSTCTFITNTLTISGTYKFKLQATDANNQTNTSQTATVLVNAIVAYVPVTFTNNQNTAVTANTQLTFVFNALAYQRYETNSLNNTVLYLSNGTVLTSWIEGNTTNMSAPANKLYNSKNVRFWVRSPSTNVFLPANTGTPTTNTIYLGFVGNTPTPANNLMDGYSVGEAPQLSTAFGQYDNGAYLFNIYGNFQGNSLPNGWNLQGSATFFGGTSSTGGVRMINDIGSTFGSIVLNNPFKTQNIIAETSAMYNGAADQISSALYSFSASGCPLGYCAAYEFWSSSKPYISVNSVTFSGPGQDMITSGLGGPNYLFTQIIATPTYIKMNFTETTNAIYRGGVYTALSTALTYTSSISNANGVYSVGGSDGLFTATEYIYWTRIRQLPPNGIMPNASIGPSVPIAPFDQIISLSNGTAVITSSVNGGLSPYSYQWLATTADGLTFDAGQANSICSNAISSTCTFATNSHTTAGRYKFKLRVIDTNNQTNTSQAVTVLANSLAAYIPITLTNTQNTAVAGNTQLTFIFNALAYQGYETSSLNNTVFYLSDGSVLTSWIEGNTANVFTSGNQLYNSNSVRFWVRSPSTNTFLPANTGTPITNTIYLGFVGNTPTPANNLMDGYSVGEAPQLSTVFGQYDNGAYLFNIYGNFQGGSLPSGWTLKGSATFIGTTSNTGGVRLINNLGSQSGAVVLNNPTFTTKNVILETSAMYNGAADQITTAFYSSDGGAYCPPLGYCAVYEFWASLKPSLTVNGVGFSAVSQNMVTSGLNYLFTQVVATPTSITTNFTENQNSMYQGGIYSGFTTPVTYTNSINSANGIFYVSGSSGLFTSYEYVYWTRTRQLPPSGIMPNMSLGTLVKLNATTTSTTSTSTTTTISTTISGGGGGGTTAGIVVTQPTLEQLPNSCILITNFTVTDTVRFTINGQNFNVTDSYIGSNYTTVIVNEVTYVLYQNMPKTLVNLTTGR